jgi:ubiquinone/menaquinone biosynthesis C-methylase UbiE
MKTQDIHFDEIAAAYDASIPRHVMEHLSARRVEMATSLVRKGRVLDVGCGTGSFLDALPAHYDTVGVDVSLGMLEHAERKGIEVVQSGADKMPFDDCSFDLVTTIAVLHHLIDRDVVRAALQEMVRVVRPGGAIIVWDHNPLNPYWRILMAKVPQDQGDERLVPARFILRALRQTGMQELSLRRMTFTPDFTPPSALSLVSRVEGVLERIPGVNTFAAHNVVVGRR